MSWEKVKLGDISLNIQTGPFGSQLHQYDYSETGIPVVMPKDLVGGKISEQSIARVSEDHVQRLKRHVVQNGDILYSRRGDVGRCAFATEHEKGWLCGTGCLRVTVDTKIANNKFVFYQLQQPETIGWVEKHAVGATMLNLNTTILSNVPVYLPPIEIQRRIADILSAYDDLIENNRKQIKLLEEAAQRLYTEWFVDLRFPGYEHTKIVDGVPEGWGIFRFSDKVKIMSGGTPKTDNSNYYGGEIPFYTPKDSGGAFFAFQTETNITEEGLDNCNSHLYPENTIIITARGTVGKTTLLAVPMAMNQSCYALKSDEINAPYYLFFALNQEIIALRTMSNGGVFNTIVVKTFDRIHIRIPPDNLIQRFENMVTPVMELIKAKTKENFALSEARDRLLPELMSGEVEV